MIPQELWVDFLLSAAYFFVSGRCKKDFMVLKMAGSNLFRFSGRAVQLTDLALEISRAVWNSSRQPIS